MPMIMLPFPTFPFETVTDHIDANTDDNGGISIIIITVVHHRRFYCLLLFLVVVGSHRRQIFRRCRIFRLRHHYKGTALYCSTTIQQGNKLLRFHKAGQDRSFSIPSTLN